MSQPAPDSFEKEFEMMSIKQLDKKFRKDLRMFGVALKKLSAANQTILSQIIGEYISLYLVIRSEKVIEAIVR